MIVFALIRILWPRMDDPYPSFSYAETFPLGLEVSFQTLKVYFFFPTTMKSSTLLSLSLIASFTLVSFFHLVRNSWISFETARFEKKEANVMDLLRKRIQLTNGKKNNIETSPNSARFQQNFTEIGNQDIWNWDPFTFVTVIDI